MLSFIASPFPTRATYDAWLALPPDEAAAALEAAEREQAAAASSAATTAVLPGSFAWVSKDPRTGQLVPYDERSSRHLEIASRHLEEEATLLVNAEDAGFIVIITFDHEGGRHVQRSANGTGERPVRRTVDGTTVHFDGVSHSVPPDWTCRFRRVAWVHLDPVSGVVAPYSKENADNAERALRTRVTACGVHINLPNGTTLNAVLSIKLDGGEHSQSTFGGFREVRRLELPDGADSSEVDVYRLPPDDSIDSERYRFSRTENHTHTHSVPLSLGCYMEEEVTRTRPPCHASFPTATPSAPFPSPPSTPKHGHSHPPPRPPVTSPHHGSAPLLVTHTCVGQPPHPYLTPTPRTPHPP